MKKRARPTATSAAAKQRRIVTKATDARLLFDGEKVLAMSAACRRIFQREGDNTSRISLTSLLTPRCLTNVRSLAAECLRTGAATEVTTESIVRADGTTAEVECILTPAGRSSVIAVMWPRPEVTRTLKALKASEKRFRSFVENVFDGVYQSSPEGDLLLVNPAMVRMLGYSSEEELLKVNIARDLYAEPSVREKELRQTEAMEERRDIELRLRRKDGGIITCLENTRVVRRSNGQVMYYEGTLKDITEWKRVQEELRKSEERYKAFITQSTEGIWCFELDEPIPTGLPVDEQIRLIKERSYVKECNFEMARQLGFARPDEILGARMDDLFDVSGPVGTALLRAYVQQGYRIINVDTPRKVAGEPLRTYQATVVGIVEKGMLLRAWGTQRDITERRTAEQRLRESEERYRQYFDEGLAGHFISEPGGRILLCNHSFARILGYASVEEILQATATDLYPSVRDRESVLERIRTHGRLDTHEIVLKRKDGSPVTVVENVQGIFNDAGELVQLIGFMIDVTERKKLEVQLREAQKMETLGTLSGGIAHDFNNILAVIRGYIALLRKNDLVAAEGVRFAEAIETAVKRGAGVVRQLLTFAREDQREIHAVDVKSIASEVVEFARVTMPEHIVMNLRADDNVWVMGDETQIHQAIMNLVLNGRDAMTSGGEMNISVTRTQGKSIRALFPDAEGEHYVQIEVTDEGGGIPIEMQRRIFEPFYTTKDIGKGSGLGLAVVYGVAKGHSGFVDVKPNGERGTVFRLYLPALEQAQIPTPKPLPEVPRPTTGTGTVLLIEDEKMLLDLLAMLLENNGYTVLRAEDGETAVQLYREHMSEISVVLSDMGLPRLGGWEVFQEMKKLNPNVKSILASGYMDPSLRTKLLSAGAVDFIQKPYVPDDILRRIRSLVEAEPKANA